MKDLLDTVCVQNSRCAGRLRVVVAVNSVVDLLDLVKVASRRSGRSVVCLDLDYLTLARTKGRHRGGLTRSSVADRWQSVESGEVRGRGVEYLKMFHEVCAAVFIHKKVNKTLSANRGGQLFVQRQPSLGSCKLSRAMHSLMLFPLSNRGDMVHLFFIIARSFRVVSYIALVILQERPLKIWASDFGAMEAHVSNVTMGSRGVPQARQMLDVLCRSFDSKRT